MKQKKIYHTPATTTVRLHAGKRLLAGSTMSPGPSGNYLSNPSSTFNNEYYNGYGSYGDYGDYADYE